MPPKKKQKAAKVKAINVVHNFGGRRCVGEPPSVATWGVWDVDPSKSGAPSQRHAYGSTFPWTFDLEEKAYILSGSATLTAADPDKHGEPVTVVARDMVTFPKGWTGTWDVHAFLKKKYAFYDARGLRIDEDESDDEDDAADGGRRSPGEGGGGGDDGAAAPGDGGDKRKRA